MTMATPQSQHTVVLPDGTSATYQLQSLDNNGIAISHWTEFCAMAFRNKPNPPSSSYFARHYYNDPRRDAALVRILVVVTTLPPSICCSDEGDKTGSNNNEIASSVRIFLRTLSIPEHASASKNLPNIDGSALPRPSVNHSSIEVGGIGEVCTSINHRRRGLSSILLKDAIHIIKTIRSCDSSRNSDDDGIEMKNDHDNSTKNERLLCSLLHASPEFRPVYSKVGGYTSVSSKWSLVPIRSQFLLNNNNNNNYERIPPPTTYIVRNARFPNDARTLQRLHNEYSEKRLITIVRSEEYWTQYVSAELNDTLWILSVPSKFSMPAMEDDAAIMSTVDATGNGAIAEERGDDDREANTILAWLSLRKREHHQYQLREFGVDRTNQQWSTTTPTNLAMQHLLQVALNQLSAVGKISTDKKTSVGQELGEKNEGISLLLPTFVLQEMKEEVMDYCNTNDGATESVLDLNDAVDQNDYGWMYLQTGNSNLNVIELTTRDIDPIPHLIWPTDSF